MANPRTSNSRLLAIGFAVLVVGVVLVLLIIRNTDDPPAQPSPVATEPAEGVGEGGDGGQGTAGGDGQPVTPEEFAAGRLPLPLPVPEGFEALAVRMNYVRSVAAIPSPGDRVNVYRFLGPDDEDAPSQPTQPQQPAEGEEGGEEPAQPVVTPPSTGTAGPPAELVLEDMEVLGIVGPLPAANDGTLTVLLATPPEVVPALMPLADAAQLWFTLLPDAPEDEATDEPSAPATEES